MKRYSIINVTQDNGETVSGYWMQDHLGTLESAQQVAVETNKVNSNRLDIAVVDYVDSVTPSLSYLTNLKRLG